MYADLRSAVKTTAARQQKRGTVVVTLRRGTERSRRCTGRGGSGGGGTGGARGGPTGAMVGGTAMIAKRTWPCPRWARLSSRWLIAAPRLPLPPSRAPPCAAPRRPRRPRPSVPPWDRSNYPLRETEHAAAAVRAAILGVAAERVRLGEAHTLRSDTDSAHSRDRTLGAPVAVRAPRGRQCVRG